AFNPPLLNDENSSYVDLQIFDNLNNIYTNNFEGGAGILNDVDKMLDSKLICFQYLHHPKNAPYFTKYTLKYFLYQQIKTITSLSFVKSNKAFNNASQDLTSSFLKLNSSFTNYISKCIQINNFLAISNLDHFSENENQMNEINKIKEDFSNEYKTFYEAVYNKISKYINSSNDPQLMRKELLTNSPIFTPHEIKMSFTLQSLFSKELAAVFTEISNPRLFIENIEKMWFKCLRSPTDGSSKLTEIKEESSISISSLSILHNLSLEKKSDFEQINLKPYFQEESPIIYSNYVKAWWINPIQMVASHKDKDILLKTLTQDEVINNHAFTPLLDRIAILYGKKGKVTKNLVVSDCIILYVHTFYENSTTSQSSTLNLLFNAKSFFCFHRGLYNQASQEPWQVQYARETRQIMLKDKDPEFAVSRIADLDTLIGMPMNDKSYILKIEESEIFVKDGKATHRIFIPQGVDKPNFKLFKKAQIWNLTQATKRATKD
ncbi:MAG: hypothetical protein JHC93_08195, partial [Parachlamydiales bacterium]|nr:hypothetical protein [Parachlamydiales bacterium]